MKPKIKTRRQFYREWLLRDAKRWLMILVCVVLNVIDTALLIRLAHDLQVLEKSAPLTHNEAFLSFAFGPFLMHMVNIIIGLIIEAMTQYRRKLALEYDWYLDTIERNDMGGQQ